MQEPLSLAAINRALEACQCVQQGGLLLTARSGEPFRLFAIYVWFERRAIIKVDTFNRQAISLLTRRTGDRGGRR